jgi:hypothetical protein
MASAAQKQAAIDLGSLRGEQEHAGIPFIATPNGMRPYPRAAGDFCRRSTERDVLALIDIVNETRLRVWKQQPDDFFDEAIIGAGQPPAHRRFGDAEGFGDIPLIPAFVLQLHCPQPPPFAPSTRHDVAGFHPAILPEKV